MIKNLSTLLSNSYLKMQKYSEEENEETYNSPMELTETEKLIEKKARGFVDFLKKLDIEATYELHFDKFPQKAVVEIFGIDYRPCILNIFYNKSKGMCTESWQGSFQRPSNREKKEMVRHCWEEYKYGLSDSDPQEIIHQIKQQQQDTVGKNSNILSEIDQ